jgi:hypothetical protein
MRILSVKKHKELSEWDIIKSIRKPTPPPPKPHSGKKGKKQYDRKSKDYFKDV